MADQYREMAPPWEAFPTYERYSMGWRMGTGEDYRHNWSGYIEEKLPRDEGTRLKYLRSYRPAPLNWGDEVLYVLDPEAESDQEFGCSDAEIARLLDLGLVEHDAAYHTWVDKQTDIRWPWSWSVRGTPEEVARYDTRTFWFFSRQLNSMRKTGKVEWGMIPDSWKKIETQLLTGKMGDIDPAKGLLTLAQMFCSGSVQPP